MSQSSKPRLGVSRVRWFFLWVFCVSAVEPAYAQVGAWRNHTSLREVTALAASESRIWVGTTGGVYSYEIASGEIERFTTTEGLHGTSVQAISFDDGCGDVGCAWIGYSDGLLDRLDVDSRHVTAFRDIGRADRYPSRDIHRIVVQGDSLLIGTAFGLVVFDKAKEEVRDTYDQLGAIMPATAVYDAAVYPGDDGQPRLWLATALGVANAPLHAPNLKDPSAWSVETEGLPSIDTRSLAGFQGRLYVGTANGLALRESGGVYTKLPVSDWIVRELRVTSNGLLGLDSFTLLAVKSDGTAARVPIPGHESPVSFASTGQEDVWIGDQKAGLIPGRITWSALPELALIRDCRPVVARCYPEGPYFSQFERLATDATGNVWAAGIRDRGTGLHELNEQGIWIDYVEASTPELAGRNSFLRIHAAPDGSVWAASEGAGLVQVTPDGELTLYTRHNSTLRSPDGERNLDYIFAGGISSEANGRIWVTNVGAAHPLHVREPNGDWTALVFPSGCGGLTTFNATLRDIYVDTFGQKWIAVLDRQNFRRKLGLIVLDTKSTPTDQADDECRYFRRGNVRGEGLPSDSVNAIAESADGLIYVATDKGLAYTVNHGFTASDPGTVFSWPIYADRDEGTGTFPLQGLQLKDLDVDPANRVWAATDLGAWLIAPVEGGYQDVQHFTAENSPLLSDNVQAVEVNPLTGEVFFATAQGLVSYQGDATQPVEEVRDLFVYPNPARMHSEGEMAIYIDGLVEATEIMILAADGALVNRFATQGGRALWDGRDANQRPVPAGVYLVVAVGQNGEGAAYGKVAVIR